MGLLLKKLRQPLTEKLTMMFVSYRNHELLMTASARNRTRKDTHRVSGELTLAKSQTATEPLTHCRTGRENKSNRNGKALGSR